jgi:palmitoyltransferase
MYKSTRPLYGTAHGTRFWLNTDVCGLICAALVYLLLWLALALVHGTVLPPARSTADAALLVAFDIIALLALASHWRTMTTDPGAVPRGAVPPPDYDDDIDGGGGGGSMGDLLESGSLSVSALGEVHARRRRRALARTRECSRCQSFRPERAYHCNVCNRCVVKMDHHCPWYKLLLGPSLCIALPLWPRLRPLVHSSWKASPVQRPSLTHCCCCSSSTSSSSSSSA